MKKIFICFITLFLLLGCHNTEEQFLQLYNDMTNLLLDTNDYISTSKYYSLSINYSKTAEENRFYIVVDSPKVAMYDVKVIAFEEGTDTSIEFAPNVGIFDDKINLVPNQVNKDNGYVKGISISGIFRNENPTILCLVQWKNDESKVYREFYKLNHQTVSLITDDSKTLDNYYIYE